MLRQLLASIFIFCAASTAQAQVKINEVTSPGGIKAWYIQESSIPFVSLELLFTGGTSSDPIGKSGATNLMTALLWEGAGALDARAFTVEREQLAARFGLNIFDETLNVSARFLTENRDEALALLKLALTQPRFDTDALERVRAQILSSIASNESDPDTIARHAFYGAAFADHPYGRDGIGTTESVTNLTRDDVIAAYDRLFTQNNVVVSAVGDINAQDLGLMLDELLGDLPTGDAPQVAATEFGLTGGITVIDQAVPQSVAIFGHSGIARDDPDFYAAFVLNSIVGGSGMQSRLFDEVREKRGLTYGIRTQLVDKEQTAMILGTVASANDRIAEAINVTKDVWRDVAQNGVSDAELNAAKKYLTGAYPLRFDGNTRIAGILAGMQRFGYDRTHIDTRNDRINAVTLDDVRRVAARILRPDDLHFVVVGQPEGLNKQ